MNSHELVEALQAPEWYYQECDSKHLCVEAEVAHLAAIRLRESMTLADKWRAKAAELEALGREASDIRSGRENIVAAKTYRACAQVLANAIAKS